MLFAATSRLLLREFWIRYPLREECSHDQQIFVPGLDIIIFFGCRTFSNQLHKFVYLPTLLLILISINMCCLNIIGTYVVWPIGGS